MRATLPTALATAAKRWPDAVAIEDGPLQIRFRELDTAAEAAAAGLIAAGLAPGQAVAIWAPNSARWIIAALGVHLAGGVLSPVNTRFKGEEAAWQLERAGVGLLFTVGDFLGVDFVGLLRDAGHAPPPVTVLLDGAPTKGTSGWEDFLAAGAGVPAATVAARRAAVEPGAISDLLFTSGTTGRPKAVPTTHQQSIEVFTTWANIVGLTAGDRYLVVPPFFHCFGYKAGWLACLLTGATVLPHAVFDANAVLARIGPDRVSVLTGPPALYQTLLQHPDRETRDLTSLRLAVTGAAMIPVPLIEAMHRTLGFETVLTAYGLTECSGVVTMCRQGDPAEVVAGTSGRAIPGAEVRIASPDGQALAPGEAGEVQVRGAVVMGGYLGDPAATAEATTADGWFRTGDVGVLDAAGNLRITDRIKDMFVVGGFNAYPAEIERFLLGLPGVTDAAVVGMPDARLGEVGCAFVVGDAEDDALHAACRAGLANYKVPRRFVRIPLLPRNASGKVQKNRLKEQLCSLD